MSGFLDVLSAATGPALQYRTGQLEGEQEKEDREQKGFLGALELARKQQQDGMDQQLRQAQIDNYKSEAQARSAPRPPAELTHLGENDLVPDGQGGWKRANPQGRIEAPTAPVRGTPAYLKALEAEERIRAKFRPAPGAAGSAPVKVSGDERKNAAFYNNALQANNILRTAPTPGLRDKVGSMVPLAGNYWTSDQYKRTAQAAYQLSEAWLRATSGAAISENEIRRNAMNYFAQPGDSDPGILLQKTQAREQIVRSLKEMAGRAVDAKAAPSLEANPDAPQSIEDMIRAARKP